MSTKKIVNAEINTDHEKRDGYWDVLKGFLIFLVVFAHFLYPYRNQLPVKYIVDIIYFFHMPAFVFISGFFSKKENSSGFRTLVKLLILYLIMNFPFLIYKAYRYHQFNWITPYYSSWYLPALIAWRVVARFLRKTEINPWCVIGGSVLIALMAGFWHDINNVLAISRIIAFLPFFLLGYYLPVSFAQNHLIHKKATHILLGMLLLAFSTLIAFLISNQANLSSVLLMDTYQSTSQIWVRLIILILAFLLICGLLLITPSSTRGFQYMERWGKNSLWVYVLHRPITLLFSKIYGPMNQYLIPVAFLLSIITVILLSLDTVCRFFNTILNQAVYFLNNPKQQVNARKPYLTGKVIVCISIVLIATTSSIPLWFQGKKAVTLKPIKTEVIHPIMHDSEESAFQQAVSIAFVGDLLMLQDQVRSGYNKADGSYRYFSMFEHACGYLSKADYAIGVYEGPSAGEEAGYSTSNYDDGIPLHINMPDSFAEAVKNSGIDLVTTANNHLLDKGVKGAFRTLDVLDRVGLDHTGSYRNREEKKSKIIQVKGLRIGILSYTFGVNYYPEEYFLDEKTSFITSILADETSKHFDTVKASVIKDFEDIKALHPDIIMVLPHMGTQFMHTTDRYQDRWNNIFLENGADIIFGDHSHAVQPIEIRSVPDPDLVYKKALIVNCPGNFANSYTSFDGDVSAIVNAYIDPYSHQVLGASISPLWVQGMQDNSFRALPIYDVVTKDIFKKQISKMEMERVEEASKIATSVMIGAELTTDQLQEYNFLTPDGYRRIKVRGITIREDLKKSRLYKKLAESSTVCFIGDSVTEGTKNGGYGWYEPLAEGMDFKYFTFAWGGATSYTLLNHAKEINSFKADLFIVAIGTNDVRYRDPNNCAMDPNQFIQNLKELINGILIHFPEAEFVFISPWLALENDTVSKLDNNERDRLMLDYGITLSQFCRENGYWFVNPNPLIKEIVKKEAPSNYLLDFIHPNMKKGIYLYSEKVLEASK